jgi:hypothetical protein
VGASASASAENRKLIRLPEIHGAHRELEELAFMCEIVISLVFGADVNLTEEVASQDQNIISQSEKLVVGVGVLVESSLAEWADQIRFGFGPETHQHPKKSKG